MQKSWWAAAAATVLILAPGESGAAGYVPDYSTYLGGGLNDTGGDIAVEDGSVYVCGMSASADFPTVAPYQAGLPGFINAVISRFDSDGNLVFSSYLGGSTIDAGIGVAVDEGAVCLVGYTMSFDFPTVDPCQANLEGFLDAFVARFDSGGDLIFSSYLGGSDEEQAFGVAASGGDIYIAGFTTSTDFPVVGAWQPALAGGTDAFVARFQFNPSSSLAYSSYLGGTGDDNAEGIAVDGGVLGVGGYTDSLDFPTSDPLQGALAGGWDGFVSAIDLNPSGSLVFSSYLGGSEDDYVFRIAADNETLYLSGSTDSTDFPTVNPFQAFLGGNADGFAGAIALNPSAALIFSSYLGGSGDDDATGLAVEDGDIILTGDTDSQDFPTAHPFQPGTAGGFDAFAARLALSPATALVFSSYLGGSGDDSAMGAAAEDGIIYLGGWTESTDFPTVNPFQAAASGGADFFVSRLVPAPPTPTPTASTAPTCSPSATPTAAPSFSPTPFLPSPPTPSPTPYSSPTPAGPQPTPSAAPATPPFLVLGAGDYSGNGRSDIAVFRPATGAWKVRGLGTTYFGGGTDIPVPGDYDGDGVTDVAVFRPSRGLWWAKGVTRLYFNLGDIGPDTRPVPADYDGDGRTDPGIFTAGAALWAVKGVSRFHFGAAGDLPVPGDYDGDLAADVAVWRPATGLWAVRGITRKFYGVDGDIPVPGTYTWYGGGGGPFRTEFAVFRPSRGVWLISGGPKYYFGVTGDRPLPGKYVGGEHDTLGIFRPPTGLWALRSMTKVFYGLSGDDPVTR